MKRFNELTNKAKSVAINNYIDGWKETHPNETFSRQEAFILCQDSNDDVFYDDNGNLLED